MADNYDSAEMAGSVLVQSEYPGHDLLREAVKLPTGYKATIFDKKGEHNWDNRVVVEYSSLLSEFDQLSARYNALKDAVVILEGGAEVGDLVYKFYSEKEGGGLSHWTLVKDWPSRDADMSIDRFLESYKQEEFGIIRNGKPAVVLYKSNITEIS